MSPYLGLDYGLSRVGVAVSGHGDTIAFAVGTHQVGRDGSLFTYLEKIISERNITKIVLGLPLTAKAEEQEIAAKVRQFAAKLEQRFGLQIVLVDERFTSLEAKKYLQMSGRRRQKSEVDAVAAVIILQQYLDRKQTQRQEETE